MIRITAQGPAQLTGAALIPVPARDARAYQARGFTGKTDAVAAPGADAVPQSWNRALHRSSDAPNVIRPDIRWQLPQMSPMDAWIPVSPYSDNQMPVPALDPRGGVNNANWPQAQSPRPILNRPVFLRQQQIRQPKVAPKFLNRTG